MGSSVDFGTNSQDYYYTYSNVFDWGTEDWTVAIWLYSKNGTEDRNIFYHATDSASSAPIQFGS